MLREKGKKRKMGIAIKKLTHFFKLTHLPQGFLFIYLFLFFMRRGSGWKFWERYPKEKLERERERERREENFLPYRNFVFFFFFCVFQKKGGVYIVIERPSGGCLLQHAHIATCHHAAMWGVLHNSPHSVSCFLSKLSYFIFLSVLV